VRPQRALAASSLTLLLQSLLHMPTVRCRAH
jgi:hypothetical protein